MSTRSSEPTWDECPHCRAAIPAGASFCPECGEPLDEPRVTHPRRRRGLPLSPAVLVVAGVAVVGLGALLGLLLSGNDDPGLADATATPTASATVEASAQPSGTAESTPSPSPTATPRPELANRSIVEVVTNGVQLLTQPGGDTIGTLDSGSRALVIGSPQESDGVRWYRVAVMEGPYSRCQGEFCPNDIGFVADGTSDADANLVSVLLDCPSSPMTAAELNGLLPFERLACYGGSPIVVTGTLDHCYCDAPAGISYEPEWLAAPITEFRLDGSTTLFMFLRFPDPPGVPEELEPGDIVEATLAMENEAAPDCSATSTDGQEAPSRASVVLACRTQLVVESLEVTGHDESAVGP